MKVDLQDLELIPYLDFQGTIPQEFNKKIGVYAIFNQEKELEFVGYSRDIFQSLKQHLIRKLDACYWFKYHVIAQPSKTLLEEIARDWSQQQTYDPSWIEPIDTTKTMTDGQKQQYQQLPELEQIEFLRQLARDKEAQILQQLNQRGVKLEIRFNPKLKEKGLLDLK